MFLMKHVLRKIGGLIERRELGENRCWMRKTHIRIDRSNSALTVSTYLSLSKPGKFTNSAVSLSAQRRAGGGLATVSGLRVQRRADLT
jgi:hypothetical protein